MNTTLAFRHFPEWGARLLIPMSMAGVCVAQIVDATNGCGREGIEGALVPDTILGLDVAPVCRIHDWMYVEADSIEDEEDADAVLAANMVEYIKQKSANSFMGWLRLRRAYKYIDAVTLTDVVDVDRTPEVSLA